MATLRCSSGSVSSRPRAAQASTGTSMAAESAVAAISCPAGMGLA